MSVAKTPRKADIQAIACEPVRTSTLQVASRRASSPSGRILPAGKNTREWPIGPESCPADEGSGRGPVFPSATDLFVHPAGKECRGHFQPLTYPAHGNAALPAVRHELHRARKIAQQLVQRMVGLDESESPRIRPEVT